MSIISEAIAGATAKKLEDIILNAINGSDWSDVRSAARGFAKKELYQWYLDECDEAFMTPNSEIKKVFG